MSQSTTTASDRFERVLAEAEALASSYLADHSYDPAETTIKIGGERYVLVRASALSVDFFALARQLTGEGREAEAAQFAKNTLYALGHAMGKADARAFHTKMVIPDPLARLAVGAVHSSRAGWAFADILPESHPVLDDQFYLIYDHAYSFEAEAWLARQAATDLPVCFVSAGYVSGWCEGTLGIPLTAVELLCRAKGDPCCRFLVAPPDRIDDRLACYLQQRPDLAARVRYQRVLEFSAQKRMEENLRKAEERYRFLFENNPHPMWVVDLETLRFVEVNEAALRHYGYSRQEFLDMTIKDIRPEAEIPRLLEKLNQLEECVSDAGIWRHRKKDGSLIDVHITCRTVTLDGRRVAIVLANDITKQQKALEAVRESEEKFRSITQAALDAIVMLDDEGRICLWNQAAEKVFGYGQEEVLGRNGHDLLAPHRPGRSYHAEFSRFRQTGQASVLGKTLELWAVRKDGQQIPIELSISGVKLQGKWHAVGIVRDISERKQAEETIQRNADRQRVLNKLLALALEDIPLEEALGRALDVVLGIPWLAFESRGAIFLVQDEPEVLVRAAQRGLSDEIVRPCARVPFGACHCGFAALTREVQHADRLTDRHEIRYEGIQPHGHYCIPIVSGGKTLGVLNLYLKEGHSRDSTEVDFLRAVADSLAGLIERRKTEHALRKKEDELRQAQKLKAVGQLAGGIAHEFNNLLQAIGGYTKFAMEGLAPEDPRLDDLKQVITATERASALTKQLLGFSRQQVLERRKIDPNEIVRELVKMVRPLIGEHIELKLALDEPIPNIDADPGEIQRALLNLCLNARDAMPTGGELTIKTAQVTFHETFTELHAAIEPGRYVVFSVSDTGCGMSDEVKQRLFEPFFTTKEVGKGTGLGLATVHGIVQQHGGSIHVYSELGKGSTFKIYLPAAEGASPNEETMTPVSDNAGTETILVAEDEPMVRSLAVRILSRAGYQVLSAADGEEALRVFRDNCERIALVILDAVMPKRTGHEVCRAIRAEHPSTKILFCSGYDPETAHAGSIQQEGYRLVPKPFVAEELLHAVREILDGDESAAPRHV